MKTKTFFFCTTLLANIQNSHALDSEEFQAKREEAIEQKIQDKGITDKRIVEAFKAVPLEEFIDDVNSDLLDSGEPIPIEHGQFVFTFPIYANMLVLARVAPEDRILNLGTGSGYFSAVLSKLGKDIYTLEMIEPLAVKAKKKLADLGYINVHVEQGEGMLGMKEKAPFDKIFITFPIEDLSQPLVDQLKQGGRIIMLEPGTEDKVVGYMKSDQGLIQIQP